MKQRKIVLAGGNGFLGRLLARWFIDRGWQIVVLARRASDRETPSGVEWRLWDAMTLDDWRHDLEDATAVVNLVGRTVNCRYNRRNRQQIFDSRIWSTHVLGAAIAGCTNPPEAWLNSSTATIYKHSYNRPMDEFTGEIGSTPEAKDAFSVEVARAWERSVDEMVTPGTRKLKLRTAMVLAPGDGGVFATLRRLTRSGLGGTMGSGRQYVSWIHGDDFCRAVAWLIDHRELKDVVNIAAPNPAPNRELMATLRRVCRTPIGLPAPRFMLEIGAFLMRTETELILKSRRVIPTRLLQSGFEFQFPEVETALRDILAQTSAEPHATIQRVATRAVT